MKTIKHLEELSMLNFTDEERKNFKAEFETILDFESEITKINLDIVTAGDEGLNIDEFREDLPQKSMMREDALLNAPVKKDGCYVTPMVIE